MLPRDFIAWTLSAGLLVLKAGTAFDQTIYPSKPVRIITSVASSASDFAARLVAQAIAGPLGQPVIVDNRSGILANEAVATSAPDGYTSLVVGSNFWIGPLMMKVPYDPVKDFAPVTLIARVPNILTVHPSLPVMSVKELIALAKARPGELNYASGSTGGSGHLAGALFTYMAGVLIVRVPYKSGSTQISDLISGQVQLMFGTAGEVMPNARSGKLKALAVSSAKPSTLVPGVPTIAGTGLPGYESVSRQGMFAPVKTPETIINRLNLEIVKALGQTDISDRFFNSGAETVGSSAEELASIVKSEMSRWAKVIKDAGIRAE